MNAQKALQALRAGYNRFVDNNQNHKSKSLLFSQQFAEAQHPKAVIVSCSDSRVPPELIFDAGFGELFTIRTAGNVVSDYDLASIEYAVVNLEVRLIIIMGHSSCGAICAAVEDSPSDSVHLTCLKEAIQPVIKEGMSIDEVAIAHTEDIARSLTKRSHTLESIEDLVITSCFYRLDTGEMSWGLR